MEKRGILSSLSSLSLSIGMRHLLVLLLIAGCQATQRWKEEPTESEVNPGGSVILPCKIYNKQGTCSWQKDGKPQGMFVGKYEWAGDRDAGDCSIRILDAGEVDDGDWECQVTASSFTAHDALTSGISRVLVRVAPDTPQMEVSSQIVTAGQNFTVQEDRPASIKCLSRHGNPPANIQWFIGEEEIPSSNFEQTAAAEVDRPKTWLATSALEYTYQKHHHGLPLRCVALHQAYQNQSTQIQVIMDVQYVPTVEMVGLPEGDIEEGVDTVTLQCLVDANPTANVVWRVLGETDVFSFQPEVKFSPASRKHSATYTCEARNAVGGSETISAKVDVKYPATILSVKPSTPITATLHNQTLLECEAEGNPPPTYKWIQTVADSERMETRGNNATLLLEDITYVNQGQYVCVASNVVKGTVIETQSQPIHLEVVGAPQVLRYTVEQNVAVEKGQDAVIQIVFCSDPQPLSTTWEWDSLQLAAGNGKGRYVAEDLSQDGRNDCYAARLRVEEADLGDARDYVLNVVNDKGTDSYAVALQVTEPMALSTVIAIIIVCIIILFLVLIGIIIAFKKEKCCFAQQGDLKNSDAESNKTDLESQKGANGRTLQSSAGSGAGRSEGGKNLMAGSLAFISPDALYTSKYTCHANVASLSSNPDHEYANLKITPTSMGTQNLCQEMRRNSSSSQTKRDEISMGMGNNTNEEDLARQGKCVNSNNNKYKKKDLQTYMKYDTEQVDAIDVYQNDMKGPQSVSVIHKNHPDAYTNEAISQSRPGSGDVYSELQLPRISNNGSTRRSQRPQPKSQYTEITFQNQSQPTADI